MLSPAGIAFGFGTAAGTREAASCVVRVTYRPRRRASSHHCCAGALLMGQEANTVERRSVQGSIPRLLLAASDRSHSKPLKGSNPPAELPSRRQLTNRQATSRVPNVPPPPDPRAIVATVCVQTLTATGSETRRMRGTGLAQAGGQVGLRGLNTPSDCRAGVIPHLWPASTTDGRRRAGSNSPNVWHDHAETGTLAGTDAANAVV